MTDQKSNSVRLLFLSSLLDGVRVTWPVLSSLLMLQTGLGIIVGTIEKWGAWDGILFCIDHGADNRLRRLGPAPTPDADFAVAIGFFGIALTGIVAALAVRALQATAAAQNGAR